MKLSVNRHILSLTTFDSGLITPMMSLMHRFQRPGRYSATVFQGDEIVTSFNLIVDKDAPVQITKVDLGAIDQPVYTVNPQAYVLFHAPRGAGGYHIVVKRLDLKAKSTVFDSRKLTDGDVFMAILLRPGRYSATNQHGARCEISVTQLNKRAIRFIPTLGRAIIGQGVAPIKIECTEVGFTPERVDIGSAQSLIFMIRAPLRIKVNLEEQGKADQKTGEHGTEKGPESR